MSTKRIRLANGKTVDLRDSDYLTSGGEGAVYAKGGTAYKLYADPKGREGKIIELASASHKNVVFPTSPAYDEKGQFVGFAMPFKKGFPLVKTFANAWRDAEGFGDKEAVSLADRMRSVLSDIHAMSMLVVDFNELNVLTDKKEPFLIDVDSWKTPLYPATAVMPSIKDWTAKGLSTGSDWFAWAILAFQMFSGIHPYKGTHPLFAKSDLEGRMKASASVFDKDVRVPASTRDFSRIPARDWFEAVFSAGLRTPPPSLTGTTIPVSAPKAMTVAGGLKKDRLIAMAGRILYLRDGFAVTDTAFWDAATGRTAPFAVGSGTLFRACGRVFVLVADGKSVVGEAIGGGKVSLPLAAAALRVAGGRLFAETDDALVELHVAELGDTPVLSVRKRWDIPPMGTRWFGNFGIRDALGSLFLVWPEGSDGMRIVPLKAKGRIVDGAGNGASVFLVVSRPSGYRLLTVAGGAIVSDEPTDSASVSAVSLANGVSVVLGDKVRVFDAKLSKEKIVDVPFDSAVASFGDKVLTWTARDVFRLSLS